MSLCLQLTQIFTVHDRGLFKQGVINSSVFWETDIGKSNTLFKSLQNKHLVITEKKLQVLCPPLFFFLRLSYWYSLESIHPIITLHSSFRIFLFPWMHIATFWNILRLNFVAYQCISQMGEGTYRKFRLHFSANLTHNIYINTTRLVSCWVFHILQSHFKKTERHTSFSTLNPNSLSTVRAC